MATIKDPALAPTLWSLGIRDFPADLLGRSKRHLFSPLFTETKTHFLKITFTVRGKITNLKARWRLVPGPEFVALGETGFCEALSLVPG